MGLRKIASVVAIAGLAAATLPGCEQIERDYGLSKEGQTGAVAGAAAGGILAAVFDANPAWIAASVILGGVAGGYLGEHLSKEDAVEHGETQYNALETLSAGQSSSSSNPDTGHSGQTTVTEVFTMADGTVCKNFTETIWADEETITRDGTACKKPGGRWEVRTA
jgi:surface antigen